MLLVFVSVKRFDKCPSYPLAYGLYISLFPRYGISAVPNRFYVGVLIRYFLPLVMWDLQCSREGYVLSG